MLNTHSTGCSAFHLTKTVYMRGQIFDKIYIRNSRNIKRIFHQKTSIPGRANKTISMIYTDLIELVGQYMTYEEFSKAHPELELTHTDWYYICEGETMRNNKKKLKQRYLDDFNDDWSSRRRIAFGLIDHEQKTST